MLRTKSQRNKLCRECPVARVADILGDACSLLIMRDLLEGTRRFGQLEDSLGGMSPRTLTKKLRKLESEGLIARRAFPRHPPRVEYRLTRKGAAFQEVEKSMRRYGKKYL